MADETRMEFSLKPLRKSEEGSEDAYCHFVVGLNPAGQPVYCPKPASMRVNDKPMCTDHIQQMGKT